MDRGGGSPDAGPVGWVRAGWACEPGSTAGFSSSETSIGEPPWEVRDIADAAETRDTIDIAESSDADGDRCGDEETRWAGGAG